MVDHSAAAHPYKISVHVGWIKYTITYLQWEIPTGIKLRFIIDIIKVKDSDKSACDAIKEQVTILPTVSSQHEGSYVV